VTTRFIITTRGGHAVTGYVRGFGGFIGEHTRDSLERLEKARDRASIGKPMRSIYEASPGHCAVALSLADEALIEVPLAGATVAIADEWSEPGSTAGIPDRYQMRLVTTDMWITAGDNRRNPNGGYQRPSTHTPWHLYETQPDPRTNGTSTHVVTIAEGVATSQELAREAAEKAAAAYLASKVGAA
jgi:hypothetical protein